MPTNEIMQQTQEQSAAREKLIARLFPETLPTPEDLEQKYPPRELPEGAMVTRVGPSPTGFMHIGGVYAALISERLAHQSDGVFFLRIEDTDQERSKAETVSIIVKALEMYGIPTDEGMTDSGDEKGKYGPYAQSERSEIYKSYVKKLLQEGKAYLCFSTNEENEQMAKRQLSEGKRPGHYGEYAKWRNAPIEDVMRELDKGTQFVIRFRAEGDFEHKISVHDVLRGGLELSENDLDRTIYKSSTSLPTYHFAHVVDDHLMGTTHVLRGDEWLPSLPLHLQLFEAMGWKAPEYGHIAPIQKVQQAYVVRGKGDDRESFPITEEEEINLIKGGALEKDGTKFTKANLDFDKRKISKRLDPEANVMMYHEQGYPPDAVVEYLMNLANSNFEDWRKENPNADNREFSFTLKKLSAHVRGPLFDFVKLNDISSNVIAKLTAEEIYRQGLAWAKEYDHTLADEMEKNPAYTTAVFNIERADRDSKQVRKDIIKWSDLPNETSYFFDALFETPKEVVGVDPKDINAAVNAFLSTYDENDDKDTWFGKIKAIAKELGYAESAKEYKLEKEKYKGQVGDVAKIFRVLLTGKTNTPDLHAIMKVMGRARVEERLKAFK